MKTIRQVITFKAPVNEVYDALMDSKKHSIFSGSKAVIIRKVGGKFFAYDGYITGKTLELVPDKKIVQEWHGSDWNDEEISKVTFEFKKDKNRTKLTFTQEGVPDRHYSSILQGWTDFYWKPMKEMLEK